MTPEMSAFTEDTSSIEAASFPINSVLNWTKAHQPRSLNFPKRTFGKDKKQRSFTAQWFDKYPWLHYDEKTYEAFVLFASAQNKKIMCSTKADNAFTKEGYINWK